MIPDKLSKSPYSWLLLVFLSLAMFLPGLTNLPAVDRDEARYAQASRQMLETGDFIDIRFQDEARYKKPVGIYWMQAAATALIGESADNPIWTYRIPSQIGALLSVLLTFGLGRLLFGAKTGLVGAVLLACTVLLNFEARMAKTDAMLLAMTLLSQYGLAKIYLTSRIGAPPKRRWSLAMWTALGIGILIKGPIIVMAFACTLVGVCFLDRRWRWLARLEWQGMLLTALIAVPWFLLIQLKTDGAFFAEAIGHDLLGKVRGAQESHGAPFGAYLLMMPLTFFPASFLIPRAVIWTRDQFRKPEVKFCLAAIVPLWLIFEAMPTKLPHYVLQTYPFLALLAAAALVKGSEKHTASSRWWLRVPRYLYLIYCLIVSLALAASMALLGMGQVNWENILGDFLGQSLAIAFAPFGLDLIYQWDSISGLSAMLATIGCVICVLGIQKPGASIKLENGLLLPTVIFMMGMTFAGLFPDTQSIWVARSLAEKTKDIAGPIAIVGYPEPSAVVHLGTHTLLTSSPAKAAEALLAGRVEAAAIDQWQTETFISALDGASYKTFGTVDGHNYSKGMEVKLQLYRLDEDAQQ